MNAPNSNRYSNAGQVTEANADFLTILRAGILSRDMSAKKRASQYSLNLIKASLDHLILINSEGKVPDIDKVFAVMKEFNMNNENKDGDSSSNKYPCSNEMLKELIKDHERIILQLRENVSKCYSKYKDVRVGELISSIIEEHKTIAWTLRRYLIG
jgi:hypothetical protein